MAYGIGQKLKRLCESHTPKQVGKLFADLIRERKVDPERIRFAELTEAFLGRDAARQFSMLSAIKHREAHLLESTEAVDASAFSNITGQLLITVIKEQYENPEFIADKLVKTIPNPGGNLKDHIVPYLSDVTDDPDRLSPLEPYPQTRFAESFVTMPPPEKRGSACLISMEMLMSDLTGQVQAAASSVGKRARYNKEVRLFRVILGLDNPYRWNGNSITTYLATAGVGNYANRLLSKTIRNYTDINDVEILFHRMVDPITGLRIMARPTTILCMPAKRYELKTILNATEIRAGNTATDTGVQNTFGNPLDVNYPILTSPIAEAVLLGAGLSASVVAQRVYFMDGPKAFFYREVYPFQVIQAPANNPAEFNQDVVMAFRVSEYGVPGVMDPRYTVQSTSEAS